ncbi:hypothetical protein [Caproiciproducens galactitolivorans]|uniref:Ribbon-helix-helix protein CopG domain-containing protein n=1 Tax=Caproiciproducens galactitolivorans TaxID=642589 RepID=A0ABT4BRE6_9FIRM|nr:hypothetical protein [Caproiciproducens galactitolivorans]MCY1713384.1 hypothetical protein [Caproiciproducens galactitolivorans]
MDNVVNSQRLSDNSIDLNEKLRTSIYLKEDTYLKIDSLIKLKGRNQSRNDVIENAVDFYFGYITSQLNQDYLCGVFGSKMEGLVSNLATRISKGNFRTAVEMDMHTRMMASVIQLNKDEYDKLRIKSIHDVKTTNGSIDILEAANESEDET